jgi:O-succinylhomoserine sulfhydrylase
MSKNKLNLDGLHIDTLSVRAGTRRTEFNEHAEAMFLTSSFCFDNAAQAAERFANAEQGFVYSRFTNPTVAMFQDRLAALEGAEACVATSSGMAAIFATAMSLLQSGDHIVCSRAVFGPTTQMFTAILGKFGVETTYVDVVDLNAWQSAVRPNTKIFYLETPSNPLTEVADIPAVAKIAKASGAILIVDNCFCTPALQKPLSLGAEIVIHSATKYLDGQGRVLGGAVLGSKELMSKVFTHIRTTGPTLSAFNAWVLLKGLETLSLRMEKQSQNALALAQWLETHPKVERVFHPGLESHPQHALAMKQQKQGGAILSFVVKGAREGAWKVIDQTELCSITANLGDTRTTITHPATTTHGRITQEARDAAGILEGLVRVSVGLEFIEDLKADLARGLDLI